MAQASDYTGLGIPAAVAQLDNLSPVSITCAGTSSGTATNVALGPYTPGRMVKLLGATSQTGAIISSDFPIGNLALFACDANSTASSVLYPPSGATISGGSSLTIAANKCAIVWRFSSTLFFHVLLA